MLSIRRELHDKIVAHARADHPDEACGVIAGPAGRDDPERFIPMMNAERSPTFYRFDSMEQFQVWKEMDERDEEPIVIYHQQKTLSLDGWPLGRQVQRYDGDAFQMDVLPDIQLRPVGNGKYTNALALGLLGVIEIPQFRPLVFRVPSVGRGAEGEDTLLGPAFLFVTACAAEGYIELI